MKKISIFNTKKLNETFNINSPPQILYEEYEGVSGCEGELNPFYGKKHSEDTKQKIRNSYCENCKSREEENLEEAGE